MFEWIKEKATKTKDWLWGKTKDMYDFMKNNRALSGLAIWGANIVLGPIGTLVFGFTKLVDYIHSDDGKNDKQNKLNDPLVISNSDNFSFSKETNGWLVIEKNNSESMDTEKTNQGPYNDNESGLDETMYTEYQAYNGGDEERNSVNKNSNENLNFSSYNDIKTH